MRTAPIYLDRLDHSLKGHGVTLKRAQLLETASYAFGYHNSGEFTAAAKAGGLTPPPAEPVARIGVGDDTLIVLRDPLAGSLYAVEEGFLVQIADEDRRERFGNSPYGHLLDVGDVADHPVTAWSGTMSPEASEPAMAGRYVVLDGGLQILSRHDGEQDAKDACTMIELETHSVCDDIVVDLTGARALHYDRGWREVEVRGRDEGEIVMAASLQVTRLRLERSRRDHEQTLRLDVPDWRSWEKDLGKASRKGQEPISDEILHQFRHAIADVHCKSSPSERSEVEYRQRRYVEKHLGGLIARLDRAEEALRDAGLAPADIARRSKEDAAETLAAIEAVRPRKAGSVIPNLYEVEATRDGEKCHEFYAVGRHELHEDRGREIVAKAFRMDLEEWRDPDGELWMFDSECDTFEIREVTYPDAAAVISDALVELSSGGDFTFGLPHSHPARIKLVAAREMLVPRATVEG
jgi:hypothetical protein